MNGDISFNANDLQTYDPATGVGIITEEINHTELPEMVISLFNVANANKSAIASDPDFPSRTISIAGTIKGSSVVDLAQRVDSFNGYFNGKDKNLDINYAGATRRYIATRNALSVKQKGKKTYAPFTVEFICTEPFGRETTTTNIANQTAYTSALYNIGATIAGSAPFQLPIITYTVNSATGSGDYLLISDDNTGQEMLLYGLGLATGDELVINSETHEVLLNGEKVDYNGTFLELEPGMASITITDGFSTRNVDIHIEYYKRYL